MESSHNFLDTLRLENYIGHDPLPRDDMENLVYNPISESKLKEEERTKIDDGIKDVICDRQDGIGDEVSQITANIQADDFFSSLELQSSSKTSSNMLSLSFSNKVTSGIVTRSRFSSCTLQESCKVPGEKVASKLKTKDQPKRSRRRSRRGERAGSGRKVKAKGKCKKVQGGKKLAAEGKDKVSVLADSKRQNSSKLEENVLEKCLTLEKSRDEEDWVLFNTLGSKKEIDDKMFEHKQISNELQNPVRRSTPELFSMSSILMSDGMSEGKDDVDNLLEAEDYDDSFLEEMDEFNYAPPRSHTGGKWKPGSLSIRTSPMLWQNQNWDSFLDERHQDEDRKPRADTPADSPTESFTDRSTKFPTASSTASKWKSSTPPATHTGGKWKPIAPPATQTSGKWKTITPPASYTGGKWKPSEFPQRLKKTDQELLSPDDGEHNWKYDTEREPDPPPTHTGGKWKPSSSHAPDLWKPDSSPLELEPPTRGKWGSLSGKSSVSRSTLDVLAHSQSTSGKCLKTSGGTIQYYCSPCNRRLSSKKMYRKHAQSELHFKRVLQENELEFDSRSLKLFHGLFTQAGHRERGMGKRVVKRPGMYRESEVKSLNREKKGSGMVKIKGRRVARREMVQCELCRVKVPSHQWGKHLVSYCHSRRIKLSDPDQQKVILENIHAIVKQAPYQCGICKFYCNTHTMFKKHWALAVHKEVEESKNQRFWCALCSFESETSRSMELHLDSNSHREVILAVNKSIPIIIRHKVVFNCGICFKEFRFNRELIRHKEIFHEKADSDRRNKFVCSICQQNCKSIKSLQRHIFTSHKDNQNVSYFCSSCNEFFNTAEEAKAHRNGQSHKYKKLASKSENPERVSLSRSCSYCEETLEDIAKLKTHLLEKHTEFLPKCIRCGMTFALSQEVSRHVKNNECDFSRKELSFPSPGSFACESCAFTTNSKSELLLHMAVHQKKDKEEKKISCPLCGSLFTQTSLSVHLRTHLKERTYECSACSKAFVRKDRYVSHLKLKHGSSKESVDSLDDSRAKKEESIAEKQEEEEEGEEEVEDGENKMEEVRESPGEDAQPESKSEEKTVEKRHICGNEECNYVAKDLKDLKNHNMSHVGPKVYRCPECSYSARTNAMVKRHYLIHVDERSFPCHLCSFKARLKSHLKRHMRLHTGAKPYKCPHCPYACNILENLRKHVLYTKIHPGKKLYECKLCSFNTNVSKDFKMHLFKCHKDEYRPAEANEVAGIYSKEEDYSTSTNAIPVKRRGSSSKPQMKASEVEALNKKVEILSQKYSPIAPKPPFNSQKVETPSLSLKATGNLIEDKRKILQMELEKLKNQIKTPPKKLPRSYPSPAEKHLKKKTSLPRHVSRSRIEPTRKKKPRKKALLEEGHSVAAANVFSEAPDNGGVLLLNVMPGVLSVAEELPSEVATALPQMEFSSACILPETVLPSEEMELYLLEDYQV